MWRNMLRHNTRMYVSKDYKIELPRVINAEDVSLFRNIYNIKLTVIFKIIILTLCA